MSYIEIQRAIYENKVRRNFNVTDIGKEIFLTTEEFGELCDAHLTNNHELVVDSIGDIMVYSFGLAAILEENADELLTRKVMLPEKTDFAAYFPYVGRSLGLMAEKYRRSDKGAGRKNNRAEEFATHVAELLQYCQHMFKAIRVNEREAIEAIVKNNETRTHQGHL